MTPLEPFCGREVSLAWRKSLFLNRKGIIARHFCVIEMMIITFQKKKKKGKKHQCFASGAVNSVTPCFKGKSQDLRSISNGYLALLNNGSAIHLPHSLTSQWRRAVKKRQWIPRYVHKLEGRAFKCFKSIVNYCMLSDSQILLGPEIIRDLRWKFLRLYTSTDWATIMLFVLPPQCGKPIMMGKQKLPPNLNIFLILKKGQKWWLKFGNCY